MEHEILNFIEEIIEKDNETGKFGGRVHTRFPPEPNGYLHIGHAKSICLNFGLSQKYGGKTNLRFDDTNPEKESDEYVQSIKRDVQWLGFQWNGDVLYASDYFDQLYQWAQKLIHDGKAYIDFSTSEEMAALKGNLTTAGSDSPYRNTSPAENLDLFERMKVGEFPDGHCCLRAKVDMASSNMLMRDPVIYRIKRAHHHRTGDKWNIYPMYDFAHGQSDSIEGITHSVCTLEFVPHREFYEWLLVNLEIYRPQQIEFARLNLDYTVMSKRKLLQLVEEKHVTGWDDPRMPTISGMRRRGYTPESLREFVKRVGVAKRDNIIEFGLLEFCVREDLNKKALRMMAVLDPIKMVITNYPEGQVEEMKFDNNPENEADGSRLVPFSREIYIERDDFMENPPKKYFRLFPGGMVRLKSAYIVRCDDVLKDDAGNVTEVHCTYIENSRSGNDQSGIHVKGTIHWVSVAHAADAELRIYERLFTDPNPLGHEGVDFKTFMNPNSLTTIHAKIEPALTAAELGVAYQFIRKAYFCLDTEATTDKLIFNQTVGLKDSFKGSK